jgi:hypothetical protein
VIAFGDPDDAARDRDVRGILMGELDHRDYPVAGPIDACHHTASGNNPSRTRPDGNQRRHKAAIARRELERQRTELNPGDEVAGPGSSRTTSSVSGWITQTVSASTARPSDSVRRPGTGRRPGWSADDLHDLAVSPRADPQGAGAEQQRATAMADIDLLCHPAIWPDGTLGRRPHRCERRPRLGGRLFGADSPHHGEHRNRPEHCCTNAQPVLP